jgi:hypothetical protein
MALRIEKRTGALLIGLCFALPAMAEPHTYEVRHKHLRKGAPGKLQVTESGISFEETGKNRGHSREWKYSDIEQLVLSDERLRVLTYEDIRWQFGRDRAFEFDQLPEAFTAALYPMFRERLDQRFVAALVDTDFQPLWQIGVKVVHGLAGSQGVLLIGSDRIAFETHDKGVSRTWRIGDIEMVSSSGPFDLAITTFERSSWYRGSPTELRFQLKEVLPESRYQQLWRMVNHTTGPRSFDRNGARRGE